MKNNKTEIKTHAYYVQGMHCSSCEILIEKKLLEIEGIESVEVSLSKNKAFIAYIGPRPKSKELNKIFKKEGYTFYDEPQGKGPDKKNFENVFLISAILIFGFIVLQRTGFTSLITVNAKSALPAFFVFGVIAGISSCAALVGGLILSMAKNWAQIYRKEDTFWQRSKPHFLFNSGRLISFAFFGALLGLIGAKLQFSLTFSSVLAILVSVIMIFLGLQMFGVSFANKIQFTLPRFITRKVADESNFKGKLMPFFLGAFTFFLPCGFTLTAQSIALLSGSVFYGTLVMFLFALGTLPSLLLIGLGSAKILENRNLSEKFVKIAGIIVLFFAFYNLNSQLNILGLPSFSNLGVQPANGVDKKTAPQNDLPEIIDGKQVIKMKAGASGYKPNYFKVRLGKPVRWEIEDVGTSGCTNAIISRGLFEGDIPLTPGKTSVKEFTPEKAGKYKFSCWMGMISGIIEVVDSEGQTKGASVNKEGGDANNNSVISSGAKGCGCCAAAGKQGN